MGPLESHPDGCTCETHRWAEGEADQFMSRLKELVRSLPDDKFEAFGRMVYIWRAQANREEIDQS